MSNNKLEMSNSPFKDKMSMPRVTSSHDRGEDTAYCTDCTHNGRVVIDPKTIAFWVLVRLLWMVKTELSKRSLSQIALVGKMSYVNVVTQLAMIPWNETAAYPL